MIRKQKNYSNLRMGFFFATIVLLLLTSMTAFWLQNTIFNNKTFTELSTHAFSQESSRQSIGELVANRVFAERPVLRILLSDRLSANIAGILATEPAQNSINRVARDSQLLFTSPSKEPVIIQLAGVKSLITSSQELVGRTGENATLNANDLPDEVMLIDTTKLPNFHSSAIATLWVGYFAFLLALLLISWLLYAGGRANLPKRARHVFLAVLLAAVVALITGPLVEPVFISAGRDAASQTLLRNIYEAFIAPFRNLALVIGSIAVLAISATVVWEKVLRQYSVKISVTKKIRRN